MWFDEKTETKLGTKESYIYSNKIGKKPVILEVLLVYNHTCKKRVMMR